MRSPAERVNLRIVAGKKKKVAGLEWLDYTECVDLEVYVRHSSRGCNKIMKLKRQIWSSQNTDFKGLTH